MKNLLTSFLSSIIFCVSAIKAQVPVREEPRHHPILQNKYIRLLDVWLPPGDTTLFHIHATPSFFVILSNTSTASQISGKEWVKDRSQAGNTWYRSFIADTLIHRVCNIDTLPFHVNDIEILSAFKAAETSINKPLPFTVIFENEKAFAYQLTTGKFNKQIIKGRGPIVAELVTGDDIFFNDTEKNITTVIKAGKYLYIEPGTSFYFTANKATDINMVLFEIK